MEERGRKKKERGESKKKREDRGSTEGWMNMIGE
jgi:hypothetical protein